MKKFAFGFALVVSLIFVQLPTAQAMDYYVGTSNTTGMECYLMTGTISRLRTYSDGARFAARLKMVGRTVQYLDYELDIGTSGYIFYNSQGYSGEATPYGTPIEWKMCQYIARNYL
ncbi:MAG: hypothetical protein IJ685_12870 [Selenomonadaceae bacterium]|nr:hypothetical protein [Selenomonadaceae bacterium]